MLRIFRLLILCFLLISQDVFAYDDKLTHPQITGFAIENSILKTDKYLSQNLGDIFANEVKSYINGEPVLDWFTKGSIEEDVPSCRASSHFLNPLKPWDKAGLTDMKETIEGTFIITSYCFVYDKFNSRFSTHKYSNVKWATGQTYPGSAVSDTGNKTDWNGARDFYKLALTDADYYNRQEHFAKTLQSLGQVIHLIQDMAVPAHTRNDFSKTFIKEEA